MSTVSVKLPRSILRHCFSRGIEIEIQVDTLTEACNIRFSRFHRTYWSSSETPELEILTHLRFWYG